MDLSTFKALLSSSGQEALQIAVDLHPREVDFLSHFTALSQRYPAELARAALETTILRAAAAKKFPQAQHMYFTREALEQASSFEVSAYRSARYRPYRHLVDLGCSIGGDTLNLAALASTIGIDRDPLRLAMAQANLKALGLAEKAVFLQADLNHNLPFHQAHNAGFPMALFFDPARRTDHRRAFSVRNYHPPLSIVREWLTHFPALGVKISPGVKLEELSPYPAEIEFISWRGELKEAVLWFGSLKTANFRATVLPGPYSMVGDHPCGGPISPPELSKPRAYLYEPDPAILRAGLVVNLGEQLNAVQLDPDIAYLTSNQVQDTPFARAWSIEDWFPFNLKILRAYLRERGVGRVIVKKRGSPIQPEELIHALRLTGDVEKVIFLTHLQGKPIILITSEYRTPIR